MQGITAAARPRAGGRGNLQTIRVAYAAVESSRTHPTVRIGPGGQA
jgi:hypothetical protein